MTTETNDVALTNWERITGAFACQGTDGVSCDEVRDLLKIAEAVAKVKDPMRIVRGSVVDKWVCDYCGHRRRWDDHAEDCAWALAFHMVNSR